MPFWYPKKNMLVSYRVSFSAFALNSYLCMVVDTVSNDYEFKLFSTSEIRSNGSSINQKIPKHNGVSTISIYISIFSIEIAYIFLPKHNGVSTINIYISIFSIKIAYIFLFFCSGNLSCLQQTDFKLPIFMQIAVIS